MNNNQPQVVFAKVTGFRPNRADSPRGFGFAKTTDGKEFYLPMWACRRIDAGRTAPELGCEESQQWPRQNDEVVILPDARPPLPGKAPCAWRWGYRKYWEKALNEINSRPIYRVVGENRFKGQLMKNGVREEEVAIGTLEELQTRFPRGHANDPVGTEQPYHSGPCQRINRWQVWKDADFVACDDPRSKPNPVAVEACNRELKQQVPDDLSQELEELAASAGGRRKGTSTPKPVEQEELVPA